MLKSVKIMIGFKASQILKVFISIVRLTATVLIERIDVACLNRAFANRLDTGLKSQVSIS